MASIVDPPALRRPAGTGMSSMQSTMRPCIRSNAYEVNGAKLAFFNSLALVVSSTLLHMHATDPESNPEAPRAVEAC